MCNLSIQYLTSLPSLCFSLSLIESWCGRDDFISPSHSTLLYTNQPEHVYVCIYRAYNTINKMLYKIIIIPTNHPTHSFMCPSFIPPLLELSCAKRSVGVGKQDKTYVMGGAIAHSSMYDEINICV